MLENWQLLVVTFLKNLEKVGSFTRHKVDFLG